MFLIIHDLHNFHCYHRARLGIGEGVMVPGKVISAGGGDGLQLVIGQAASEMAAAGGEGVVELVVRIAHLIHLEHLFETTLVKPGIVRHQRQAFDLRDYLLPYIREHWRVFRVLRAQAVHLLAEPLVVFRFGVDQAVETVHDFPAADDDDAHAAHAGAALVGRLEVHCCKIPHNL